MEEDEATKEFISKKEQKIKYRDLYVANIILLVLSIVFILVAFGFMGWAIYEQVTYNQCNGDIEDTYDKIQDYRDRIHTAEQELIKCETIDCPVPVCHSCCPPCTNYSGQIYITGNSTVIYPGTTTTNPLDFTDFGNVNISTYVERVFIIHNNATTPLRITGRNVAPGPGLYIVPISSGVGTFTITQYQIMAPVTYTGQLIDITTLPASITVRFTASSSVGNTVALFQVASSDPLVSLYTFYLSSTTVS